MKKVILILPKTGIETPDKHHLPHSILSLAQPLIDNGYEPILIDARVDKDCEEKIKENLKDTICVGISSFTGYQIKDGIEKSKFVKSLKPDIPVIWGGIHASSLPEQTLNNSYIDIVVKGEGERIIPMICKRLENKESLKGIPSAFYKTKEGIKSNNETLLADLNKQEPFSLIDIENYIKKEDFSERAITLITSRGCDGRCTFCYNHRFNKGWRGKEARYVVDDIELFVNKYKVDGIDFFEDNFFVDKKRVEDICNEIIKREIKVSMCAQIRINILASYDDDFMNLLEKAGFKKLICGIESGSQKILNSIKKGITVEQVLLATEKLKKHNLIPLYTFMCGFPNETREDIYLTFDLIDKIRGIDQTADFLGIFPYTVYPSSSMYKQTLQRGFIEPKSLEEWSSYSFYDSSERMGWLSKKEKNFMQYIYLVSRFALYKGGVNDSVKNPTILFAYSIMKKISSFRWKHRFFKFPLDLWLVYKIFKFRLCIM